MPTTPEPQFSKEARDIVTQLMSPFSLWREEGEQELRRLAEREPERIFEIVQYLEATTERQRIDNARHAASLIPFVITMGILWSLVQGDIRNFLVVPIITLLVYAPLIYAQSQWRQSRNAESAEATIRILVTASDDIRSCGLLVESLKYRSSPLRSTIIDALKRHLSQIQPEHHELFNAYQRECLYRALDSYDHDFLLALLHAIEQIGDANAIPYVERLLKNSRDTEPYIEKAKQCLTVLEARAEEDRSAQTLLRPSQQEDTAPDTLLRPATGHTAEEEQPQTLLRPAGE